MHFSLSVAAGLTFIGLVRAENPSDVLAKRGADIRARDDELGVKYITITDSTNALQFMPGLRGTPNMTVLERARSDTNWALTGTTIMGDSDGGFLHYFPSTMEAFNVSRLRVRPWGKIPKSARMVTLSQISTNGTSMITATSTTGEPFFLVVCLYQDQLNKVFLARDTEPALERLADPSLRYIMTGGQVSECNPLKLNSTQFPSLVI